MCLEEWAIYNKAILYPCSVVEHMLLICATCHCPDDLREWFVCLFVYLFVCHFQGSAGLTPVHEELRQVLSPAAVPGGDPDGGGHQEVRHAQADHDPGQEQQEATHP